MSFADIETSRTRGSPQTLYQFACQNKVWAYTDNETPIVFTGRTYRPIPVDRGALATSGTLDKSTLQVDLPHDTEVAELFRVFPPSDIVTLTVFQGHEDAAEFLAVWTGRVISCARNNTTAQVMAEPVSTSMKRPGLRRRFQYGCPHALYGPKCRVNRAAFTRVATVSAISRTTITLEAGWNGAFDKARFVDGMIEWVNGTASELRSIKQVDAGANQILINGSAPGLSVGETLSISLGCNHLEDGCQVFDNLPNFGGCPWIPKRNPIGFVNNYD